MKNVGWFAVVAVAVILEVATAPGTSLNGQSWKLARSGSPGMVHFTMQWSRFRSRTASSTDVPLASFRGFSLSMLDRSGPAKFEYVEEAGKLECEGRFAWGRGSGSFTMVSNPDFVRQLNAMGFGSPDEDDLFYMMLANVNLDYARVVHDAAMGASLRQLIEMRQHGVTAQYIHDVNEAGYKTLLAQDFIELRDHGVQARFLWDLKAAGYHLRPAEVVELREHGVNSQFLDELKQAGYDLPANQITELTAHGVNSSFVRGLKMDGVHPPAADLVELREHGVTPEFLRGLHDAGYPAIAADEVVALHEHGVSDEFAIAARDLGYRFTPRELIELREHGVDAKYLRTLHDSGIQNLNASQITQLRMHGVD